MLKKLRIRFVCVLMSIVLVVLCLMFGFLYRATQTRLESESISMMQELAKDPLQLIRPSSRGEVVRLPYILIRLNEHGEMLTVSSVYFDISDRELLQELIAGALGAGGSTGVLQDYHLRYYNQPGYSVHTLVFADMTSERATLIGLARTCMFIGVLCLGIFFAIAMLLAKWMVRPVEQAWKQQKQFVSDASHELKTPLTVILTNAELLQMPETEAQTQCKCAESILAMSHQMRLLVEQLLELARSDNGTTRLTLEEINLSQLVEDSCLPFEAAFYEAGLTLATTVTPDICLTGSRQHLGQLVDILLDNARKYATGSEVTLTLLPWGRHHCRLAVSNPCQELSQEALKDIFKRFYRLDAARSRDGSFGLGLSIAESIVTTHRGKIWAEWKSGIITFTAELPIKEKGNTGW